MEIRSANLFLAIGITFVLALTVGVMMWFGQQHLAKLKAQQPAHERSQQQAEQAHGSDIKAAGPASMSLTDAKQAAVEHCRQAPDIKAWLRCMEREGINTRDLLKTGQ
jgi:hypothetical protein